MKDDSKKEESKGCLTFAGLLFAITAFSPLMTLILGGDPRGMKGLDRTTGEVYDVIFNLRLTFIGLLIALIYYIRTHYFQKTK